MANSINPPSDSFSPMRFREAGHSVKSEAFASADLRVLVMCLFHATGDDRWLAPPFRPTRDVRLVADPCAGFDDHVQQEIRETASRVFAGHRVEQVIGDPGPELFGVMMSACLGETVPEEYVPMARADFGFDPEPELARPSKVGRSTLGPDLDVAVIGAGVSGICLGSKLASAGIDFTIIERNPDVGGTWFDNRYPGCGVDTPNHFYSYSFAPNPRWRHYFSPRAELQEYLEDCADSFGVRDRIRHNQEATAATWDPKSFRWVVALVDGNGTKSTIQPRVLVSATGHFNQPLDVNFAGSDSFGGATFHTARWPSDANLRNLRVGVIGTGASAMQLVPSIAAATKTLTVFQRTPQWVRPVSEYNDEIDPATRWLFETIPYYASWYRFTQSWRYGDGLLKFLRKDRDWPHPARALNTTNDRHREEMTAFIADELSDRPELIPMCVPTYPAFGKRILIDNGWYRTLCQPHVDLVTDTIDGFEVSGIRTVDGTLHELDVVVLATGFIVTNLAARMDVTGLDGVRLAEDWADENPTAHLGICVPGFPNFFVMYGPNTNMGHGGSGMWLAETQTRFIMSCLSAMIERELAAIDVREEVRAAYTEQIDRLHDELIWTHPGMTTYYRNRHGKVRSPMPFRLVDYWTMTRAVNLEEFHLTPRRNASEAR